MTYYGNQRTASNARKTIEVGALLDQVNDMLRKSVAEKTEARMAVASLLETVLMETGNYRGFAFTDSNQGNTDATRRVYYRASNLNSQVR